MCLPQLFFGRAVQFIQPGLRFVYGILQPADTLLVADIVAFIAVAYLPAFRQCFFCVVKLLLRRLAFRPVIGRRGRIGFVLRLFGMRCVFHARSRCVGVNAYSADIGFPAVLSGILNVNGTSAAVFAFIYRIRGYRRNGKSPNKQSCVPQWYGFHKNRFLINTGWNSMKYAV